MSKKFNWDDYEEVPPPQASFNWDKYELAPDDEQIKPLGEQSSGASDLLRGWNQGSTLGFQDELAGAAGAVTDKFLEETSLGDQRENLKKKYLDVITRYSNVAPKDKAHGERIAALLRKTKNELAALESDGFSFKKSYEEIRDQERSANKKAQENSPGLYMAGELAGSIAGSVAGGAALKGSQLANSSNVSKAIAGGMTSGAGLSEANNSQDLITDTLVGGALAGTISRAAEYAPKLISKGFEKIKKGGVGAVKKASKAISGLPDEYIDDYLKNSDEINGALELEDLVEEVKDGYRQLQDKAAKLDAEAWQTLSTKPAFAKAKVLGAGDDLIKRLLSGHKENLTRSSGVGETKKIIEAIQTEVSNIAEAYGDDLSEADLKSVIQDLQKIAYSYEGNPKYAPAAIGLRQLSGTLNSILKLNNKPYAAAMEPVEKVAKDIARMERHFVNKSNLDDAQKITSSLKQMKQNVLSAGNKPELFKVARSLEKEVGMPLNREVKNLAAKEAFEGGRPNGSRNTLMGALAGRAITGVIGAGAGALAGDEMGALAGGAAGFGLDRSAPKIIKKIIDGGRLTSNMATKLGRFAKPLADAVAKGPQSVAVTHYILSQNPDYLRLLDESGRESED